MANLNIAVEIAGKDAGAGSVLSKIEGHLKGMNAATVAVGVALGNLATGAGVALAGGLGAAVSAATDFEKQMSAIKAVSGATGEEFASLQRLALDLGRDTSFSAKEAAAGIEELVKGGLSIEDIMGGAAKATLELAAAGGVSLPEAATIAANALAQFNLKGSDMAHVADLIAGAANASAIDVSQFRESLQQSGAVAAAVGFSFDDLATGIAVMGKAGIAGADAGTSLKTMMLNLTPSTDKAAQVMEDLGLLSFDATKAMKVLRDAGVEPLDSSTEGLWKQLAELTAKQMGSKTVTADVLKQTRALIDETGIMGNAFFDANGKVKSMADVAKLLQGATKNLTEEQRLQALQTIFGSDAIRAAVVLAKEGGEGFDQMAGAMGKVTAASVAAERLNNLQGSLEALKGSLETLAIEVGLPFLPILNEGVKALTGGLNAAMPMVTRFASLLASNLSSSLGRVTTALQPLVGSVQTAFQSIVGIVQRVTTGDLRGAVNQIMGLFVGSRLSLVETLAGWGKAFIEWIGPLIPPMLDKLGLVIDEIWQWVKRNGPSIMARLKGWADAFVEWIGPLIPPMLKELGRVAKNIGEWIGREGPPLLEALITEWVPAFANWLLDAGKALGKRLGPFIVDVLGWIEKEGPGLLDKLITEWVPAFIGWVAKAGEKIAPKLLEFVGEVGVWVVKDGVPAMTNAVVALGVAFTKAVGKGILDTAKWLWDEIPKLIAGLKKWIDEGGGQRFSDGAKGIGKAIIEGIAAGFAAHAKWLWDQISNFASNVAEMARQKITGSTPRDTTGGGGGSEFGGFPGTAPPPAADEGDTPGSAGRGVRAFSLGSMSTGSSISLPTPVSLPTTAPVSVTITAPLIGAVTVRDDADMAALERRIDELPAQIAEMLALDLQGALRRGTRQPLALARTTA